jgi:hypothetical protein
VCLDRFQNQISGLVDLQRLGQHDGIMVSSTVTEETLYQMKSAES